MDGLTPIELRSPIWLLGDSYPAKWLSRLNGPLDPRHPARQNIWTPILNEIQRTVYSPDRLRLDEDRLCVLNAADNKENGEPDWDFESAPLQGRIAAYSTLIGEHHPPFILAFGRRAYVFARRAMGQQTLCRPSDWTCKSLGVEFLRRIENFHLKQPNLFPLLHATIARGKWLESHVGFTGMNDGNYFVFTGRHLGGLLRQNASELDVWIKD